MFSNTAPGVPVLVFWSTMFVASGRKMLVSTSGNTGGSTLKWTCSAISARSCDPAMVGLPLITTDDAAPDEEMSPSTTASPPTLTATSWSVVEMTLASVNMFMPRISLVPAMVIGPRLARP